MSTNHHYKNAPITEAIIDLRVEASVDTNLENIKQVCEKLVDQFPTIKDLHQAKGEIKFNLGKESSVSANQNHLGYQGISEDQKNVYQFIPQRFTFSRLAPYVNWNIFRDDAKRIWNIYRKELSPTAVTRLAVRYINRFNIPEPSIELKDYFRTSPEVSPDLPQSMANFFMQLQLPQDDIKAMLLLNQTIAPPEGKGITSIILDIDLSCNKDLVQDEKSIWDFFETLRNRKNIIFEACITDKIRELII